MRRQAAPPREGRVDLPPPPPPPPVIHQPPRTMTLKVDFTPEQKEALRMFESVVESYDLRALGCGRWLWAVVRNPIFL